jgi:2-succinyl-5-enolpyruvyl-6-hydroxy-3-cyclohexene-1-carboxylate synthase
MEQADISLACAAALIDGLVGGGAEHACLSPGSRSTPLAIALARDPRVRVHVHLDERSSAFFALGLAKVKPKPVIVATTSGTAAAELFPAVVEASQSRTPLVLLTADRPPRVRGTGANQTIAQPDLFGGYVRTSLDLPVPATLGQEAWWRQAAREALEAMYGDPPGPIHLNCPFEEPLSPSEDVAMPAASEERYEWPRRKEDALGPDESDRLADLVSGARGAIVIGAWPGQLSGIDHVWSQMLGWPIVAEPISGSRRPGACLEAGQALIGSEWAAAHRPEVVIQFGAAPTTRTTQSFVASAEKIVVADRFHLDPDPDRRASWRLAVDPGALGSMLGRHPLMQGGIGIALTGAHTRDEIEELWRGRIDPAPEEWREAWSAADRVARLAMDETMEGWDEPFEPRVARDVAAWAPDGGFLFVGNSTPIRDLDLAMTPRDGLRVLANRGASGIDGLVSTALGVAAADRGPTVALLGDLSFLHDVGAVLWNAPRVFQLTIVVVNNGGGQVFSLLPQRDLPEHRELFVTPHTVDIGALCVAAGVGHERVERASNLLPALDRAAGAGGLNVVVVMVDAELGLRRRREMRDAVDTALAGT